MSTHTPSVVKLRGFLLPLCHVPPKPLHNAQIGRSFHPVIIEALLLMTGFLYG